MSRRGYLTKTEWAEMLARQNGVCCAAGCDSAPVKPIANGLACGKHYQRWWKYGSLDLPARQTLQVCTVDSCSKPVRSAHGTLCEMHYARRRRASALGDAPSRETCLQCGEPITSRKRRLYCSERCAWRFPNGRPNTIDCTECGVTFERTSIATQCSRACAEVAASRRPARNARGYGHVARAKRHGVEWEHIVPAEIYERDGWVCQICQEPVDRAAPPYDPLSVALDHRVAMSAGGTHTRDNVQCAHFRCNGEKAREETRIAAKIKRQRNEKGQFKRRKDRVDANRPPLLKSGPMQSRKRQNPELSQYEKRKRFGPAMKSRNSFQDRRNG